MASNIILGVDINGVGIGSDMTDEVIARIQDKMEAENNITLKRMGKVKG